MNKFLKDLPPIDPKDKCLNVIIETPKGSSVKYAYDPESGFFRLSKALPAGMIFPFNFGFIPNTLAEDGDPLDILILNEGSLISGALLKVRPIAVIKATQTAKGGAIRNDRVIGEAISKEAPVELQEIELNDRIISQIEFFFTAYNQLYGKKFNIIGTGGPQKAKEMVRRAAKFYRKKTEKKKG